MGNEKFYVNYGAKLLSTLIKEEGMVSGRLTKRSYLITRTTRSPTNISIYKEKSQNKRATKS